MEPPHSYLWDTIASVVHHADYLNHRDDHALCGVAIENLTALTQTGYADAMCPDCGAKLVVYHLEWWREKAQAATAELEMLRVKYRELKGHADTRRRQPAEAQVEGEQSRETALQGETEPKTFLDHARRELAELCRQFDGELPYWRLKNTMQAFSDRLDTHERVLLAEEIGADSSLIRWSTTEVDALGWHVTNSPVHEDSSAMWDAWVEDSYQAPKKAKRRLGRFR